MNRLARHLMATVLATGLLTAPATAGAEKADAKKQGPSLDGLVILLSNNHADPEPEALEAFRPGLYEKLATIESDGSRPRIARIRALASMAREDADRTVPRVVALIDDADAAPRLRIAAGWTLGYPLARHPVAVPTLRRLLGDRDPGLRERAVLSLSRIGSPQALALLEQHRIVERHVVVRTALRQVAAETRGVALEALRREGVDGRPLLRTQTKVSPRLEGEVLR